MKPTASPAPAPPFALEDFLPYRLSVLSNTVSDAIAALYRTRFDLTMTEWRCMAILYRFAPVPAQEVARRGAMDKVRVSRAVAALAAKGHVLLATDRTDRRRSKLALSAAGRRLHDEILPLARGVEARLLAAFDAQQRRSLDAALVRLAAAAAAL